MYDLIIVHRKLNIKKIIALIIVLVLLIVICTILGIKHAEENNNKKYEQELEMQKDEVSQNQIKEETEKKEQEELKLQENINKISNPLTEDQQYNILHIYNSTGKKRVFLTFDDGPTAEVTPFILDALKQADVKATFFLLGINVSKNPDLVKREFNEGHYLANHGYSHKYSEIYASPEATLNEYNTTQQEIRDILGNQNYRSNVFRFPGGSIGGKYDSQKQAAKDYLLQNGIVHLDWNALSEDAAGKYTKEQLLANTESTIGQKDSVVILMHDAADKILTYEMLPDLINYLKSQGYVFENIYDII